MADDVSTSDADHLYDHFFDYSDLFDQQTGSSGIDMLLALADAFASTPAPPAHPAFLPSTSAPADLPSTATDVADDGNTASPSGSPDAGQLPHTATIPPAHNASQAPPSSSPACTPSTLTLAQALREPLPPQMLFQGTDGQALYSAIMVQALGNPKKTEADSRNDTSVSENSSSSDGASAGPSSSAIRLQLAAEGIFPHRRPGRPRTLIAVDPEGQAKRTRGELEKQQFVTLQEVVDGKAMQLLKLSVENTTLQEQQELLSDLVQFRSGQMDFIRRSPVDLVPNGVPWPVGIYPWVDRDHEDAPTVFMPRDPAFVPFPGPLGASFESLKHLATPELFHQFKLGSLEVSRLLLEVDAPNDLAMKDVALRSLEVFMRSYNYAIAVVSLINESAWKNRGLCFEPPHAPPPDSYWLPLLETLKLTFAQRRRMADLFAMCRQRLADLETEREQIAVQLQRLIGGGNWTSHDTSDVLQQDELATALYENMMKEKSMIVLVGGFVRCRIFSTIQEARCLANAYPYIPDHPRLASIMYDQFYGPQV